MAKPKVKVWFPELRAYQKKLGMEPKGTVQKLIDSEVIRLSDKYAPSDTGYLRKSVFENTETGSGKVTYDIYGNVPGRNSWNDTTSQFQDRPTRGPFWSLRMWASGGREKVMLAVKRFMGGNS